MCPLEVATEIEPVVGWRVWRIVSWTTFSGAIEPRLAALGGVVWPTRRRTEALCIFCFTGSGNHDAPAVHHTCGIHAVRDEASARSWLFALASEMPNALGYAIGRVSLWGRTIEHELGWRAQFAYPYELIVDTADRRTATHLRDAYLVDVEWRSLAVRTAPVKAADRIPPEPVVLPAFTEDDLLLAWFKALVTDMDRFSRARRFTHDSCCRDVQPGDVLEALIVPVVEGRARHAHGRPGYASALAEVCKQLRAAVKAGLFELGTLDSHKSYCRLTPSGKERLLELGIPARMTCWLWDWDKQCNVPRAVSTEKARLALERPHRLFDEQARELRPVWIGERREAQAQGRRAYRTWLRERRKQSKQLAVNLLPFTDEELLETLGERPMIVPELMDRLAPGKPSRSESATVAQQLVRLRERGLVQTVDGGSKRMWIRAQTSS